MEKAKAVSRTKHRLLNEFKLVAENANIIQKVKNSLKRSPKNQYTGRKKEILQSFDTAFDLFVQEISKSEFQPYLNSSTKSIFTKIFDNELISQLKSTNPITRKSIEHYIEYRLSKIFHVFLKQKKLNDKAELKEAYNTALEEFFRKMRNEDSPFRGEAAIETYFQKIFNYRCIDVGKKKNKLKETISFDMLDEYQKDKFSAEAWANIQTAQLEFNDERLEKAWNLLKANDEPCHSLLNDINVKGFSHKEIAKMLSSTADRIKARAWKCRKKLKSYYNNLN